MKIFSKLAIAAAIVLSIASISAQAEDQTPTTAAPETATIMAANDVTTAAAANESMVITSAEMSSPASVSSGGVPSPSVGSISGAAILGTVAYVVTWSLAGPARTTWTVLSAVAGYFLGDRYIK